MKEYLPYLVSIITALISAIVSISVCRKQTKVEIEKIREQAKANLEMEREKFQLEKEKMELEYKLEIEKIHAQNDDVFASGLTNQLFEMVMQNPEVKEKVNQSISNGLNKK